MGSQVFCAGQEIFFRDVQIDPKLSLLIRKFCGSPQYVTDSGQIRTIQLLTVKRETKKSKYIDREHIT